VTNDATINGVKVGEGGGSIATNTAVGASALAANTTGANNLAVGYQAGQANTTGSENTSIGVEAGKGITTGTFNIAVGFRPMDTGVVTGTENTAVGRAALRNLSTGNYNTALGAQALLSNTTASFNTVVGYQAGYSNTTGTYNTVVGYKAGYGSITGGSNAYFGDEAGFVATGSSNCFIGQAAGYVVTTGSKNTILGSYTGNQGGLDIRTASNYIVLSDGDGNPRAYWNGNDLTTAGYISNKGLQTIANSSGTLGRLGYITTNSAFQVSFDSGTAGVQLSSGATSWGTFSDERLKNVTGTYTNALSDIAQIQPVKFTWKSDTENKPQVGVIAQSVQAVVPEAIDSATAEMDGNTEYLQVRYTELIPLMIAAIQEQQALITALTNRITALENNNATQ
jgi:hypothetical protein